MHSARLKIAQIFRELQSDITKKTYTSQWALKILIEFSLEI